MLALYTYLVIKDVDIKALLMIRPSEFLPEFDQSNPQAANIMFSGKNSLGRIINNALMSTSLITR